MTKYGELITAATAALRALRSYQYGNSSPELAKEVADVLEIALQRGLDEHMENLQAMSAKSDECLTLLEEIKGIVSAKA